MIIFNNLKSELHAPKHKCDYYTFKGFDFKIYHFKTMLNNYIACEIMRDNKLIHYTEQTTFRALKKNIIEYFEECII